MYVKVARSVAILILPHFVRCGNLSLLERGIPPRVDGNQQGSYEHYSYLGRLVFANMSWYLISPSIFVFVELGGCVEYNRPR